MSSEYPGEYGSGTQAPRAPRHSFEWGLAGMIMGATLVVAFPLFLLVIAVGSALAINFPIWPEKDIDLANTIAHIAVYLGVAVGALGLLFSVYGCIRGLGGRAPLGASVGGVVLALAGLVLMVAMVFVVRAVSREFYQELPRRQPAPMKR